MKQLCFLCLLLLLAFPSSAKKKKRNASAGNASAATVAPPSPPNPFAKSDRITYFENVVVIKPDGTLLVTEKITIYNGDGDSSNSDADYIAAGGGNDEIKRGIIRTFPTKYIDRYKLFRNTTFTLLEVKMNDENATWKLNGDFVANGYTLRIGDPANMLPSGKHTYTIVYETAHQVKFLDQYDELVWNVNGNGWNFRVDSAKCIVVVPSGDSVFSNACYTGAMGDTSRNCTASGTKDTIIFKTTRALKPYEGLTVATSWRKGLVKPPSFWSQAWWILKNNIGALGMPLLLIIVLLYNTFKWWRHGRDPHAGTIIPQYDAPAHLSPAATGFIYFRKTTNKLIAATITDLALRNLYIIDVEKKGMIFKNNEYSFKKSELPFVEAGYEDFKGNAQKLIGTTIRKGKYNSQLGSLDRSISTDLKSRYSGKGRNAYFRSNNKYLTLGVVLPLLGLFVFFFIITFNASLNPWAYIPLVAGFVLCLVTQFIFSKLMPAYTAEGRRQLDYIEGYRMYLKTTDENRLNTMNPPERTIDLFEKNLAYAIALDCEVEWGKKFESIIDTAVQDGTAHAVIYHTGFSSGSGFSGHSFSSAFTGAISSASTPPSSSSGGGSSFGGGSSGGGGGGGGGGGW